MNVGEEIVAEYLRYIVGCDAIKSNVQLHSNGGEIDLIGVKGRTVYLCEVAIHINGLRYTHKGGTKDNLINKFKRIREFVSDEGSPFCKYTPKYMFFSPIVRIPKSEKRGSQIPSELVEVQKILGKGKIDLDFYINEDFYAIIDGLKAVAKEISYEIKSPVMRLFQIESRQHK